MGRAVSGFNSVFDGLAGDPDYRRQDYAVSAADAFFPGGTSFLLLSGSRGWLSYLTAALLAAILSGKIKALTSLPVFRHIFFLSFHNVTLLYYGGVAQNFVFFIYPACVCLFFFHIYYILYAYYFFNMLYCTSIVFVLSFCTFTINFLALPFEVV